MSANPLREPERFAAGMHSFAWLKESVSGATDVDCQIERRGRFLIIEGKTWNPGGITVPLGQHIALTKQARLECVLPGAGLPVSYQPFSVYLVGEPPKENADDGEATPYHVMRYGFTQPASKTSDGAWWPANRFELMTRAEVRAFVLAWWRTATES